LTHLLPSGFDPAPLLLEHADLFQNRPLPGPVLDLACGEGRNGLFLASLGLPVILLDRSTQVLRARRTARSAGLRAEFRVADLETDPASALDRDAFGAILVFRYLHRPLIPPIRDALRSGGLLVYETFTVEQRRFGRPRNPDFLLNPGELRGWFEGWEILFEFEGTLRGPDRAVAQLVCLKP
jgi:SAM-dependent methyltransferase